jgi:hypothetical protein
VSPPPRTYGGAETTFGVQDKSRALHRGELLPDGGVRFVLNAQASPVEGRDEARLSGPFVHGPAGSKFLYLGWRPAHGPADGWTRRWKISLAGIPWTAIEQLRDDEPLIARVRDADAHRSVWLDREWITPAAARR